MSKILIFRGTGQYEAIEYFTDSIHKAFKETNIDIKVLDLSTLDINYVFNEVLKFQPDLTIGFNAIMFSVISDEKAIKFYKYLNLRHLAILVDHPIYHLTNLDLEYDNIHVSCVDEDRVNYLKDIKNFNNSFLMYHAVDKDIDFKIKDKEFDVVFFGTIKDCEVRRKNWSQVFNKDVYKLIDKAIEIGIDNPNLPIKNILDTAMKYYNYNFEKNIEMQFHYALLPEIDGFLRDYFRQKFISGIKKHKINIFGNCYDNTVSRNNNVILKNLVNFNESIAIMQKSKISLNCTIVGMYNGSHERPLNSAMAGSVIVSNSSPFFKNTFGNNASLIELNEMSFIDDRIDIILKNENIRKEMAENSRENVLKKHTWNNRVDDIIKKFKL